MPRIIFIFLLAGFILFSKTMRSQYLRALVGTDIPMQYKFGLNYQQGKIGSFEMSLGYVGYPYNGDLYRVISVPEKFQARKEFLMETTDDGWVWTNGLNVHFGKWYAGLFAQRLELNASATYEYILGSELFQQEISPEDRQLLNVFLDENSNVTGLAGVNLQDVMRLNMVAWQGGIKIGRRFFFNNKRWEFRAEFAFSKNLSSTTESSYDEALFDEVKRQYNLIKVFAALNPEEFAQLESDLGFQIPLDVDLDGTLNFEQREDDIDEWFHEYGYIPTLNFHLTYLLFVPNKLKAQQQKVEELQNENQ